MTDEKIMVDTYREGDEEPTQAQEPKLTDVSEEEQQEEEIPLSAVLLLKYKDRVEIAPKGLGIEVDHEASAREIRDIVHSVYCDFDTMIKGKEAAKAMATTLVQASRVIQPPKMAMTNLMKGMPGGRPR